MKITAGVSEQKKKKKNRELIFADIHLVSAPRPSAFFVLNEPPRLSLSLLSLPHCYCIDHNNVSGDTPFHGHSSETELHKPFTTRSP